MASQYVYPDNTEWKASPFTGKQILQTQENDVLIYFGSVLPVGYEGYPHMHLSIEDGIFRYEGTETPYFRTANNNNTGMTTKSKIACATLL
ncbi:MAG: hypothetical protein GQ570_08570 [Helicobacteraceae bacterium]|nr:hypothetical protein [Helicobacteraceae bacterium]